MIQDLTQVMWAMTAMACLGVATFFFRFWRRSRDRVFLLLGLAVVLLAAHWVILAALEVREESRHFVYLIRLAAFLVIIVAIVDKNRARP